MSRPSEPTLSSWGMFEVPGQERSSEELLTITETAPLSRGLGRSYGDSSFPSPGHGAAANTRRADRLLAFDEQTGILRAEAGLSLHELLRIFLPRGYFPPTTPGTAYVTLGGMVASDVHGKNHHVVGCFGEHVKSLLLRVADGRLVHCAPTMEPELFRATVGGMGLTGHILEVEFQLSPVPSPWISYESERVPDIDAYVKALRTAAGEWPMTVGWIDCVSGGANLGRGLLSKGRWAEAHEAPQHFPKSKPKLAVPFYLPGFTINPLTVRAFNTLYYWKHFQKQKAGIQHPGAFFYPLDGVLHWNRVYGRRGMTQYQCVLPDPATARPFLEMLARNGGASFLCVIKDCGAQGTGMLSFPMKGISIAVDVGITATTQKLVDTLNEFVIREGGRIYLTKDTFTRRDHFERMEPRLGEFLAVKRKWDPQDHFRSVQYDRLMAGRA
ncbi:MAG: FAD-binding oxidoreductase [Myxococcaceae bacterium]